MRVVQVLLSHDRIPCCGVIMMKAVTESCSKVTAWKLRTPGCASHLGICRLALQQAQHGGDELAQRLQNSSAQRYSGLSRRLSMQAGAPVQYLQELPDRCPLPALPAICIVLLGTQEVTDHILCCVYSKQDPLQCTQL